MSSFQRPDWSILFFPQHPSADQSRLDISNGKKTNDRDGRPIRAAYGCSTSEARGQRNRTRLTDKTRVDARSVLPEGRNQSGSLVSSGHEMEAAPTNLIGRNAQNLQT